MSIKEASNTIKIYQKKTPGIPAKDRQTKTNQELYPKAVFSSVVEECLPCTCLFLPAIRIPSKRDYYQRWILSFSYWNSQNHPELSQNISEISIKSHRIPEDPGESHKNPESWGWVKIGPIGWSAYWWKNLLLSNISLLMRWTIAQTQHLFPPYLLRASPLPPFHTRIPPPRLWDWQLAPVGGRRPLPTELHSFPGWVSQILLCQFGQ